MVTHTVSTLLLFVSSDKNESLFFELTVLLFQLGLRRDVRGDISPRSTICQRPVFWSFKDFDKDIKPTKVISDKISNI